MRRALALLTVAAMLFAACAKEGEPEAATPEAIKVTAADYKFVAPSTVKAGAVEITLSNAGPEPHQAQLVKLKDGIDAKKVVAAAKTDASAQDVLTGKIASGAGGPNAVGAGEEQSATLELVAGRYAFICLVPDAKGRPHAGLGMVKELTVEANDNGATVPEAALTSTAKDFSFTTPTSWNGAIEFTNAGKQPHEYQVLGVAEGKTPEDVERSFTGDSGGGPPPWTAKGGGAVIDPGDTETFEMNLETGTYFLMCFVSDPAKKAPHFALGMMKRFEVK